MPIMDPEIEGNYSPEELEKLRQELYELQREKYYYDQVYRTSRKLGEEDWYGYLGKHNTSNKLPPMEIKNTSVIWEPHTRWSRVMMYAEEDWESIKGIKTFIEVNSTTTLYKIHYTGAAASPKAVVWYSST